MHVLVTGATGTVGRFVVPALDAAGHRVTTLGRHPGDHPWDPRRPRAAPAAGRRPRPRRARPRPRRLPRRRGRRPRPLPPPEPRRHPARSSTPPATPASSFSPAAPSTATTAAARPCARPTRPPPTRSTARSSSPPRRRSAPRGVALRATGVYGGRPHKWAGPLRRLPARRSRSPPRLATEVHGADLAAAVLLLLDADRDRPLQRLRPPARPPRPPRPRPGADRLPAPAAATRRRPAARRHGDRPPPRPRLAPRRPRRASTPSWREEFRMMRRIDAYRFSVHAPFAPSARATRPPAASRSSRHRPAAAPDASGRPCGR